MQLLLMKGADIEAKSVDGTPLQCAALYGNVDTVEFLLGRGAEVGKHCDDFEFLVDYLEM